ncbi:MAG: esterase family protein [Chloroflexia bacterium]|nr:esterase family protein [Chloroflexia bacterium]
MSIVNIRFFSDALGKWTRYNAILPDVGKGPYRVLMQLHGLSDDEDALFERSNLVRYVGELPLIVVLPDGGTSGYLKWKPSGRLHKQRYEDLLIHDIPNHVRHHFQATDAPWAIGGLSMGGYGAVRLGLKYPQRFASVYGHSSRFLIDENYDPALVEDIDDADPYRHAEALAKQAQRPVISFDCGTDDQLLEQNRRFHAHLDKLGIEHHYAEHPGAHTWDYWDEHVREALTQHAEVFGIPADAS